MKEKHISRVDSEKSGMFGYLLRFYRGSSVVYQQWFSDKEYGGKENCLCEALHVRDFIINELNFPSSKRQEFRPWNPVKKSRKSLSNTGHLGITQSKGYKMMKDGTRKDCPYISAFYVEERGKPKSKKFYITKSRSREQAIKEAVAFRKSKEISARAAAIEYNRKLDKQIFEAENKIRSMMPKMINNKTER